MLTQFNFAASPHRDSWLHSRVMAALATWALASVALQALREGPRSRPRAGGLGRRGRGFLTVILLAPRRGRQLGGRRLDVVGYPLLVAASGLWFRVRLVWFTTALAEAAYGLLVLDARPRGSLWQHDHQPNIVMAAIALDGLRGRPAGQATPGPELLLRAQAAELTRRARTGNSSAPYGYCRRIRGASGAAVLLSMARTTPGVSREAS